MKTIKKIAIGLAIAGVAMMSSCSNSSNDSKEAIIVKEIDIVRVNIGVKGMTCVGCEVTLEESISKIEGVVSVRASHSNDEAVIEFDSTRTDERSMIEAIKESGYKPFTK